MLLDGDNFLRGQLGDGLLLDNLFILAVVYAATALPFTIYLLSSFFNRFHPRMRKRRWSMVPDISKQ